MRHAILCNPLFYRTLCSDFCQILEVITYLLIAYRPKKLPTVPETLLKRRKKLEVIRQARTAARKATAKVIVCVSSLGGQLIEAGVQNKMEQSTPPCVYCYLVCIK